MTLKTLQTLTNHTITYEIHGSGAPIVFIHGVGMQAMAWQPQIDFFKKKYRVIAVNVAGHNGSSPLAFNSSLADFVEWFNDFMVAIDLQQATIIGHSMGALIAQGYAVQYPHKTVRAGLLNAVFCRTKEAKDAVIARAKTIKNNTGTIKSTITRWFDDKPEEEKIKKQVSQYLLDMTTQGYATTYTAFAHGDNYNAELLHTVQCPMLLLTGELDLNSTPEMSKKIASIVKQSQVHIIKNHKHMVNLTAPHCVNKTIDTWLTET